MPILLLFLAGLGYVVIRSASSSAAPRGVERTRDVTMRTPGGARRTRDVSARSVESASVAPVVEPDAKWIGDVMKHVTKHASHVFMPIAHQLSSGNVLAARDVERWEAEYPAHNERTFKALIRYYTELGIQPWGYDPGRWPTTRNFADFLEADIEARKAER